MYLTNRLCYCRSIPRDRSRHGERAIRVRVCVAARRAPGVGRHRDAAQQDERAPRHRRHRRLRLPLPPALPHAHVREDRAACTAWHSGWFLHSIIAACPPYSRNNFMAPGLQQPCRNKCY